MHVVRRRPVVAVGRGRVAGLVVVVGVLALPRAATAAPTVWAIDDGEKIKQDATALPFATGTSNPVWSPGAPIHLVALQNETVAFQVVVQADAAAIMGLTVDVGALVGPSGATIANDAAATDPTSFVGRPVERFVEHYFDVTRASGGSTAGESLGWSAGSGPAAGAWTGLVADALIPVEVAPAWDPYPMQVAANRNGVVWVDVTVDRAQPAGTYTGEVDVAAGGARIASLPLVLDVRGATLPDRPIQTMLYYDATEIGRRVGTGGAAEANYWKLLHRHRLSPMHDAETAAALQPHLPALDGSEYTAASGYAGPGEGLGDGVLSLGAYGSYGAPTAKTLAEVEGVADVLGQNGLFATTEAFVYAQDETCGSSYGAGWKSLLAGSSDPNAGSVRVGWTCSAKPASQAVDIPIVFAGQFDPAAAAAATGKEVWIYNGQRPQTDAFFTDTSAIAPRANMWIAVMAGIPRWFYWETTFWYDDNSGGHGSYDPFVTAETFHNGSGDYCEGDGVLVYPGKQVDVFTEHSVGVDGVLPSVRLKNLRRGVEDAGYYALAHAANASRAEAIAAALLPSVLSAARDGKPVSWTETGQAWFAAREALLALIPQQAPSAAGGADAGPGSAAGAGSGAGGGAGGVDAGVAALDATTGSSTSGVAPGGAMPVASSATKKSGMGCALDAPIGAPANAVAIVAFLLSVATATRRRRPSPAPRPSRPTVTL